MEDKDFLSYFWDISQYPNKQLKLTAAKNIVQTLLTVENIKKSGNRKLSGGEPMAETTIMKKYRNNDYGSNITEDLNYTLSRLIKGMSSDNNGVKEGFYIAFSLVLASFRSISPAALIKTIVRETAATQAASKKEAKSVKTGRVLLLAAIAKSGAISNMEKGEEKEECVKEYVRALTEYYKENVWLQSLISKVLFDFIDSLKEVHELLQSVLEVLGQFMGLKKGKEGYKLPPFMANTATLLMLFAVKKIHKILKAKCKASLMREDKVNEVKAFLETVQVPSIGLDKYADFLVDSKKADKKLVILWEKVLLPGMEDEEKAEHFKRISFTFLTKIFKSANRISLDTLSKIISKRYVKVWAKSMHSSSKSPTQILASEAESHFSEFFEKEPASENKSAIALAFLKEFFGPDAQQFFTPTRHAKLYKILIFTLKPDQLKAYLRYLAQKDYAKEGLKDKDAHLYSFIQFTNLLNLSSILTEDIILEQSKHLLKNIVDDKNKHIKGDLTQVLYSAIGLLNKRFPSAESKAESKGFTKGGKLWIRILHELIGGVVNKEDPNEVKRLEAVQEAESISKTRQKIEATIGELKKQFKKAPQNEKVVEKGKKKRKMSEVYADAAEAEKVARLTTLRNISLSFEKLILNLAVFCFTESDEEAYDSIKELQKCYENMDIVGQAILVKTNKKVELDPEKENNKKEALEVYVDFLVELLTRSHMFIREVGNFAFQQISKEITESSLENLLNIITTPNAKASKMITPVDRLENVMEKPEEEEEEEEDEEEEKEPVKNKKLAKADMKMKKMKKKIKAIEEESDESMEQQHNPQRYLSRLLFL
eukprot:TRINITY_DN340_c3_g1_i1.p2 TRINITY_DN340_c3_g1~~TRINITY_DN340_c3_g1_i1.p2  ORF type:complete len:825 (+),score=188.64 TRINITY_DN340_c3_g1_i1:11932-14406(+)